MEIIIDDTTIDTLTVKFWRDKPGPNFKGTDPKNWGCHIGQNFIEGVGGFGKSPLLALQNLAEEIAKQEGHPCDAAKIFLR
ncbi:hypothetical protein AAFN60_02025 [Roseibacillus persicicus]|uniref:hypothetical protein n=1 Tax=Roseibacillus persicicus TaxID=454148 RepID=UPI00398B47AE